MTFKRVKAGTGLAIFVFALYTAATDDLYVAAMLMMLAIVIGACL